MKKILVIALALVLLLPLIGCAPKLVTAGFYQHKYADYVWISFESEGIFVCNYVEKVIGAADLTGTYTVEDGKVICTDGKSTLIFEIVDKNTVRYLEEGSQLPYAFYLDDGTELIRKEK